MFHTKVPLLLIHKSNNFLWFSEDIFQVPKQSKNYTRNTCWHLLLLGNLYGCCWLICIVSNQSLCNSVNTYHKSIRLHLDNIFCNLVCIFDHLKRTHSISRMDYRYKWNHHKNLHRGEGTLHCKLCILQHLYKRRVYNLFLTSEFWSCFEQNCSRVFPIFRIFCHSF